MYEAVRDVLAEVLADPSWDFSTRNVMASPTEVPQPEDLISLRLVTYNERRDSHPYHFGGQDDPPTQWDMSIASSVMMVDAHGAKALAWLDTFLAALDDDAVIQAFADAGFSVVQSAPLIDVSSIVGAREQLHTSCRIELGCRVIRKRVTTYADTISLTTTLAPLDGSGSVEILTETSLE